MKQPALKLHTEALGKIDNKLQLKIKSVLFNGNFLCRHPLHLWGASYTLYYQRMQHIKLNFSEFLLHSPACFVA